MQSRTGAECGGRASAGAAHRAHTHTHTYTHTRARTQTHADLHMHTRPCMCLQAPGLAVLDLSHNSELGSNALCACARLIGGPQQGSMTKLRMVGCGLSAMGLTMEVRRGAVLVCWCLVALKNCSVPHAHSGHARACTAHPARAPTQHALTPTQQTHTSIQHRTLVQTTNVRLQPPAGRVICPKPPNRSRPWLQPTGQRGRVRALHGCVIWSAWHKATGELLNPLYLCLVLFCGQVCSYSLLRSGLLMFIDCLQGPS